MSRKAKEDLKKGLNLRLSPITHRGLEELGKKFGLNRTQIIEWAVSDLALRAGLDDSYLVGIAKISRNPLLPLSNLKDSTEAA